MVVVPLSSLSEVIEVVYRNINGDRYDSCYASSLASHDQKLNDTDVFTSTSTICILITRIVERSCGVVLPIMPVAGSYLILID